MLLEKKDSNLKQIWFVCPFDVFCVPILRMVVKELTENNSIKIVILSHKNSSDKSKDWGPNVIFNNIKLLSTKSNLISRLKFFSLIEFYVKAYFILRGIIVLNVVFVNDAASILTFFKYKFKKTFWQLEYKSMSYKGHFYRLLESIASFSWSFSDTIIFPTTERMALALADNHGLLLKQNYIIPNTCHINKYDHFLNQVEETKISYIHHFISSAKSNSGKIVVYSGGVGMEVYNLEIFLSAMKNIDLIYFIVIGINSDITRKYFDSICGNFGLNERVLLANFMDYAALKSILSLCDFGYVSYKFIDLNTFFAAPGKINDYLSSGLVVISDCFQVNELVKLKCGISFIRELSSEKTEHSLTNSLKKALTESYLSRTQIIKLFNENYSLEVYRKNIIDAFVGEVT